MFSLAYNFPTATSNSSKFQPKKKVQAKWIIQPSKLRRKKYVEARWIFQPSKLLRKKYVETTWILRPSKLHQKKYVETTRIFQSTKLHRKCTWKWRGNSSKFGLQLIDVISKCPLGSLCIDPRSASEFSKICNDKVLFVTKYKLAFSISTVISYDSVVLRLVAEN